MDTSTAATHSEPPSLQSLSLSSPPVSSSSTHNSPSLSTTAPSATQPAALEGRPAPPGDDQKITYRAYQGEEDLGAIVALVDEELSEPYNLYTYRYFLDEWYVVLFALCSPARAP
jgi:hypothetical protein